MGNIFHCWLNFVWLVKPGIKNNKGTHSLRIIHRNENIVNFPPCETFEQHQVFKIEKQVFTNIYIINIRQRVSVSVIFREQNQKCQSWFGWIGGRAS